MDRLSDDLGRAMGYMAESGKKTDKVKFLLKHGTEAYIAKIEQNRDALLEACKEAKKYLEPDLVEPGRTVFWKLVKAIAHAESKGMK